MLQRRQPSGWTLIGAQMVALHGLEHGKQPPRLSNDIDVLANVRVLQDATRRLSQVLVEEGFEMDTPNMDGLSHRFRSKRVSIDLLAPEGLGKHSDLTTVPPAHTLEVLGGSQALKRTELVEISIGEQRGPVPRPTLLGAVVIKACAVSVDDVPENQRADLAFLLALIPNPRQLSGELTKGDRRALRARQEMLDQRHPCWLTIDDGEGAHRALSILIGLEPDVTATRPDVQAGRA